MGDSATIEIPREVLHATRMTPQELKCELAIHLYQENKLSFGKAREVVVQGAGQPGAEEIGNAAWIEKQSVANLNLVRALRCSRRCL